MSTIRTLIYGRVNALRGTGLVPSPNRPVAYVNASVAVGLLGRWLVLFTNTAGRSRATAGDVQWQCLATLWPRRTRATPARRFIWPRLGPLTTRTQRRACAADSGAKPVASATKDRWLECSTFQLVSAEQTQAFEFCSSCRVLCDVLVVKMHVGALSVACAVD